MTGLAYLAVFCVALVAGGRRARPGVPAEAGSSHCVVVVESENRFAALLRHALVGQGYCVHEAPTGTDGLAQVAGSRPDVVILDLALPDLDGLDMIRTVREWSAVPLIVLSSRGDESDKVAALDTGADDYLFKPFGIGELMARMRVALRHRACLPEAALQPTFSVADLRVDRAARRVTVGGAEVHLTPLEYRLLTALVRQPGRVVTHHQLLGDVWGPSATEKTNYLRGYMMQLRRKLEADAARPRYLLSEPGVGYRLAAE